MDAAKSKSAQTCDPQKDLRAVLICNLSATGMSAEQIAELMNMPVETVAEYMTNRH